MYVVVKTKASVYKFDRTGMKWERKTKAPEIRTEGGKLLSWPKFKVGYSTVFCCPPHSPLADARMVVTSEVVEISDMVGA